MSTILRVKTHGVIEECALPQDVAAAIGKLPPWNALSRSVVVLPLSSKAQSSSIGEGVASSKTKVDVDLGVLVLGVNTHQPLDENYYTFLNLVSAQMSSALVAARAYQQERKVCSIPFIVFRSAAN